MDYLTEPSVREMFIYMVITLSIVVFFLLALLSPVWLGGLWRVLRGRGKR
jgi:hypothetical protein